MKCTFAFISLALFGAAVVAKPCHSVGDRCSKQDYDSAKTKCECNAGRLLFCGNDVLKEHYTYEVLTGCRKPKKGGLQCVDGHCTGGNTGKRGWDFE